MSGEWVGVALRCAGLLAGLACLGAVVGRRAKSQAPLRACQLLDRRPLGRDAGVAVVAFGGRELLVGYGSTGVSLLWAPNQEER